MTQKLGYGYQNLMTGQRPYSAAEEQALFAHFQAIHPGASLFLDNEGRAQRAKALVPECAVVVRSYVNGEGDLYRNENSSPQTVFNWYKNTPKGLIRNILNEPNGYVSDADIKRLAHWCAEIADLFGNAGIPVVLPNFGEGHPNTDKLYLLEELWAALDKWHDLHYFGCHEYGSHLGMVWNGGDHKYDMFPWRVGRFETFIMPYLQRQGYKIPNVILTEFGCDSAHDNTSFRGWKTCWTEKQYFDEIQAAITKVYTKPYYAGLCLFSWGNTGKPNTQEDWETFDLSGAMDFRGMLEASAKAVDTPKPSPPHPTSPLPDPKPDNLFMPIKKVLAGADKRNIRNGKTTKHKVVALVGSDDVLTMYSPIITQKDTDKESTVRRWQWVEVSINGEAKSGWLAIDDLWFNAPPDVSVDPVVVTPPPSSTTLPPVTDDTPVMKTYRIPLVIEITTTSKEAAEAVAEQSLSAVQFNWQMLLETLKVYPYLPFIEDVQFKVELP